MNLRSLVVIYNKEENLQWYKLPDKGLEVAVVAHADYGEKHGENIGLSRAFNLAERFGAIPIDHILAYELKERYSSQFKSMMKNVGSNHTWLSTTLCIYTGKGEKDIRPTRIRNNQLLEFGYIEENNGMNKNTIVTSGNNPPYYLALGGKMGNFENVHRDSLESFIYVNVPVERENQFNVIRYPNYQLKKEGSKVLVRVDWNQSEIIPRNQFDIEEGLYKRINNSLLLPNLLKDGFRESTTHFNNPTIGFFAPAEGYGSESRHQNNWRISTRGEAVIIQRPLR